MNGLATILLFILIAPQMLAMTADGVEGRVSPPDYRRTIRFFNHLRLSLAA